MNEEFLTITFEECRGQNGVPVVSLPVSEELLAREDYYSQSLLLAAVEGINAGARVQHPGLGDELNPDDFELLRGDVPRHYLLRRRERNEIVYLR